MITRIFGAVTGGRLNLRASANFSASILSSIPNENLLVITFIRLPVQPAGRRHWLTECLCFCLILLFSRSRVIMHGESGLKYPFRQVEWIEISLSDKRRSFRWKNWNPAPLAGAAAEKHIRIAIAPLTKNTNPCAIPAFTCRPGG